jgi:hypothetical protein
MCAIVQNETKEGIKSFEKPFQAGIAGRLVNITNRQGESLGVTVQGGE